jgi:hypothetical protein
MKEGSGECFGADGWLLICFIRMKEMKEMKELEEMEEKSRRESRGGKFKVLQAGFKVNSFPSRWRKVPTPPPASAIQGGNMTLIVGRHQYAIYRYK